MRHIKKALSYSVAGGLGLSVIASLQGCSDQGPAPPSLGGFDAAPSANEANQFLVVAQTGSDPDTYQLVEKHPTNGPTRAILRLPDGSERFLSEDELKRIAAEEAARVEDGTSRLTQDPAMHAGGLSLGEVLVAAAAGSLIGGMLANRLAGNANYQRTQQSYGGGRPTATISQPARTQTANRTQPRSGFFGGGSGRSSSGGGFGSFGG
ncbi:MAG: hypothetical protein QNJ91_01830 [Gammaproteobacteria bacterium]|nr:hypothetical protein [Gammaproteobacteria bacterium]